MQRKAPAPRPVRRDPVPGTLAVCTGVLGARHGHGGHTRHSRSHDHAVPAHAGLPRAVVEVVFPGADAVGAEGRQRRVRRPGGVALRVCVERRLVVPQLQGH